MGDRVRGRAARDGVFQIHQRGQTERDPEPNDDGQRANQRCDDQENRSGPCLHKAIAQHDPLPNREGKQAGQPIDGGALREPQRPDWSTLDRPRRSKFAEPSAATCAGGSWRRCIPCHKDPVGRIDVVENRAAGGIA